MDVDVTTDRVTFKTIGGILNLFMFLGPTPEAVTQGYHQLIGTPHFPPYWALGWHQCRYGYVNYQEVESIVAGYAQAGMYIY